MCFKCVYIDSPLAVIFNVVRLLVRWNINVRRTIVLPLASLLLLASVDKNINITKNWTFSHTLIDSYFNLVVDGKLVVSWHLLFVRRMTTALIKFEVLSEQFLLDVIPDKNEISQLFMDIFIINARENWDFSNIYGHFKHLFYLLGCIRGLLSVKSLDADIYFAVWIVMQG